MDWALCQSVGKMASVMGILHITLLFLAVGASAKYHSKTDEEHCTKACWECPEEKPLCTISPSRMEFSCLCLVHHAICNGFAQNVVYYNGKCKKSRYHYLDHPETALYSFRGVTPVILREGGSPTTNSSQIHKFNVSHERPVGGEGGKSLRGRLRKFKKRDPYGHLSEDEKCKLFLADDPGFQKAYRKKHFQCRNVQEWRTQKLPLKGYKHVYPDSDDK